MAALQPPRYRPPVTWLDRTLWRRLSALCLAALLALPAAAHAAWLKAETPRFIVYSDAKEASLRAYAAKLETFDHLLRLYHALDPKEAPPRKFTIYLVKYGDIHRAWPGVKGQAGVYVSGPTGTFAIAMRSGEQDLSDLVVFHEYTHHFMYQNFPYGYPSWITEGYAEYFGNTDIDKNGSISVGKFSEYRFFDNEGPYWIQLQRLISTRGSDFKGLPANQFYGQSWLLTHYMMADPVRRKQLNAYLLALGKWADSAVAMEQATGVTLKELTQRLRRYDQIVITKLKLASWTPPPATVTPLPASADRLLLENVSLGMQTKRNLRARVLETIRNRAAVLAGDRFADLTLAKAEILYGDIAAGAETAEIYLKRDPADLEAVRLLGLAKLRLAAREQESGRRRTLLREAGRHYGQAYKLDPTDYQTLFFYAASRTAEPDYPTENTVNVLLEAHALAPQVLDIRMLLADALMRRGRFDEAKNVLAVVAGNPHRGKIAERAAQMIKAAEARQVAETPLPAAVLGESDEEDKAKSD
jgi:hypothetical protein